MTSIFSARFSHVAAILAAGAAIAFAAPADAARQTSARGNAERTEVRNDNRRICVEQGTTGTRITRRVCRTAAEWQATEGYVPR